jgi:hypothetical protein
VEETRKRLIDVLISDHFFRFNVTCGNRNSAEIESEGEAIPSLPGMDCDRLQKVYSDELARKGGNSRVRMSNLAKILISDTE